MLRWSIDSSALDVMKLKHRSKRESKHTEDEHGHYVDIDVTTSRPIRIQLDDVKSYVPIHTSFHSKLFKVTYHDNNVETLIVRWMHSQYSHTDKDDVSTSLVPNEVSVPRYRVKYKFSHQGMHVSVGLRNYIEGRPLSEIIRRASNEELDHYKLQIRAAVTAIASVTSQYYGHITEPAFRSSTLTGYIRSRVTIESTQHEDFYVNTSNIDEAGWNKQNKPRLCHGSLWPDHIIVNGTSVEGIVGWSSCDFLPESTDRYMYYMWYVRDRRSVQWQQFLSSIPCVDDAPTTQLATEIMVRYCEAVALHRADLSGKKRVQRAAIKLLEREQASSSDYPESLCVSDKKSLSVLTEETIDSWENFAIRTESTVR